MSKKVVVIGGGAAGLMAAGRAAERGHKVVLLEKMDRIGRKLLISGKGRCNITNDTDIEGLIDNIPGNGNFLYSSFYSFSNENIRDFFKSHGLETKVERGGRVFPVSDRAWDVVEALKSYAIENKVEVRLNTAVSTIITENNRVCSVRLRDGSTILADAVILATGGASYPRTGSTGDGYRMAEKLGHKITDLKPSLIPLLTEETWVSQLMGLSLKNVSVTFFNKNNKKIYSDFGEMLFTHFGVSGPIILSASRHVLEYGYRDVRLIIDLKPALDEAKLDDRIQRDFIEFTRKQFKNSLDELLPQKLIPVIVMLSGIHPEKPVNQITKEERKNLVRLLKGLTLNIKGSRPIEEAIVTCGGISVEQIESSTMESKLIKGLYFAGELIDVDGYTGGFNLTIAFSTGYLAGDSC